LPDVFVALLQLNMDMGRMLEKRNIVSPPKVLIRDITQEVSEKAQDVSGIGKVGRNCCAYAI